MAGLVLNDGRQPTDMLPLWLHASTRAPAVGCSSRRTGRPRNVSAEAMAGRLGIERGKRLQARARGADAP